MPNTKTHVYEYARPAMTVDVVVFHKDSKGFISVLLIERGGEPFRGMLALPGGYVNICDDETCRDAAVRELEEETGIIKYPEQLNEIGIFDDPNRNPLGRVMSVAYTTVVREKSGVARDDAVRVEWCPVERVLRNPSLKLAFDHEKIIRRAYNHMYEAC